MNNEEQQGDITKSEDPCAPLRAELEEAQKKAAAHLAGWQRAAADYQNLQKQTAEERKLFAQFATERLMHALLPVLEGAKQALDIVPQTDGATADWAAGVRHVFDGLWQVLRAEGLEEMGALVGKPFDPKEHESAGSRHEDGAESGVILAVERPGYRLHGRILRPAHVIISE